MAELVKGVATNAGPYVLADLLGKGASGSVHVGIHYVRREKVAVKVLVKRKMDLMGMRSAKKELVIMKLIEHPHVISFKNAYETEDCIFLIMELAVGGTVMDRIKREKHLQIEQARIYTKQLLSAMHFCHIHHICHRDIKTQNLLLDENMNLKVGDFGFAEFQRKDKLDEINRGTFAYSAPEVINAADITKSTLENDFQIYNAFKADIWSIGVVIYVLVTSHLPFSGQKNSETARSILKTKYRSNDRIPQCLHSLFSGIFKFQPEQRWSLEEIENHEWVGGTCMEHGEEAYVVAEPVNLQTEAEIDQNILKDLQRLNYFSMRSKFISRLLSKQPNIERSLYTLLKNFRDGHAEFKQMQEIELEIVKQEFLATTTEKTHRRLGSFGRVETVRDDTSGSESSKPSSPDIPSKQTIGSWFRSLLGLPEKKDLYMVSTYGKTINYVRTLVLKSLEAANFTVVDISLNKYLVNYINRRVSFRKKVCRWELFFVDVDDEVSSCGDPQELGLTSRNIPPNERIVVVAVKHIHGSRYRFYKFKTFVEESVTRPAIELNENDLQVRNMKEAKENLISRVQNMSETDDSDDPERNIFVNEANSKPRNIPGSGMRITSDAIRQNKLSPIEGSPPDSLQNAK